jgi:hypothetical protein
MNPVRILISYAKGNQMMLGLCLRSLFRHTSSGCVSVSVLFRESSGFDAADAVFGLPVRLVPCSADEELPSSQHAAMLDEAIRSVEEPFVLTLDSDCFPVADGWFEDMMGMAGRAAVVGIRQPWKPPDVDWKTIEGRFRRSLNWNNTHVACQLVPVKFIREHGLSYGDGDDTGLAIPIKAREVGAGVDGWMPSGCGWPDAVVTSPRTVYIMDPELNRESCVLWGDRIYHHGGASRGEAPVIWPYLHFRSSRRMVMDDGGAERLAAECYRYRMDREEDVWGAKMQAVGSMIGEYLKRHKALFKE